MRDSYPGKGLHSSGGVARLKPVIEELMQRYALTFRTTPITWAQSCYFTQRYDMVAELDPDNPGVLVVQQEGIWSPYY